MTTVRVGNNRLLRLAKLLRNLPPNRFDYNEWVGTDWQGDPGLSCGTTACALGWATTMPSLRRIGLYLRRRRTVDGPVIAEVALKGSRSYRGSYSPCAFAGKVFALSFDDACYLFIPDYTEHNMTAVEVAEKIEDFVADRDSR